jgi:hypothetical protein
LIVSFYSEVKLRWNIASNFYQRLVIEEDKDLEFKETYTEAENL